MPYRTRLSDHNLNDFKTFIKKMKQLKKYILICTSTNIYTGHHLNWGSSFNKYKLFSFRRNQMFGKLKRCSKTNGLIGNWEWFGLWVNVAILIWKSSSFHLHINQNERVSSGFVDPSNGKWNSNCISCYAVQNWYTSLWERSVFFIIPEKIKKKEEYLLEWTYSQVWFRNIWNE